MLGRIVNRAIRAEQKVRGRRLKRKVIGSVLLFAAGYMVGVHRKTIWAGLTGEELPEVPKGHCFHHGRG